jgi:uncharacterized oligopeptide transporter (OPT) family protein
MEAMEEKVYAPWVNLIPSIGAFGFALILPGELKISIAVGGSAGWVWMNLFSETYERYAITLASGMIAGEALLGGLVLPLWAMLK